MWNHASNFSSYKSSDGGDKTSSPMTSAGGGGGGSANTVSSERSEAEVETWMILEYCDKGSLQVCSRCAECVRTGRRVSVPQHMCAPPVCNAVTVACGIAISASAIRHFLLDASLPGRTRVTA